MKPFRLVFLLGGISYAAKPSVTSKEFNAIPDRYFYFEDSSVILYHDTLGTVLWRSDDEGETWNKAHEVKELSTLISHPFDKHRG